MNDITLLRDCGPEAPVLTSAARHLARVALMDEVGRSATVRGRISDRLPSRRAGMRIGAGLAVAAVAWSAAVVIAAPDPAGTVSSSVTLVDFEMPTFPLTLEPVPDGLRPAFDGTGDGSSVADYRDAADENGFTIYVGRDEAAGPDEGAPGYRLEGTDEVAVDGQEARIVRYSRTWCTDDISEDCGRRSFADLTWERAADVWIRILGDGRYRSTDRLVAVAESLVDRPQPSTLSVGLAPAGWSVQSFKMGRVLTLVSDADERQTLTVQLPLPEDVVPPDEFRDQLMGSAGRVIAVAVHGRPAHLILLDSGYPGQRIWFLQAQFADGTTFELQVPEGFTQEQVVEMAEQVTYNP